MRVRAVIFDLDGVLIDSEPSWRRATRELLQAHGRKFKPVIAEQHMGMRIRDIAAVLVAAHDLAVDPEEFGARLIDMLLAQFDRALAPMEGAAEALALVAAAGLPMAVATSSPRRVVNAVMKRFGWRFAAVCSGDDVENGKPAPDIYQLAAARLGVDAGGCVAIEDSVNGVRAAKAAGMRCIAVPAGSAAAAEADLGLPSLAFLTAQHLKEWHPRQDSNLEPPD